MRKYQPFESNYEHVRLSYYFYYFDQLETVIEGQRF